MQGLRPSPSARLLACQPATCHPASGPSVYETGLAHPATRPSTAQPSPPSPSSRRNQQRSPAARLPATHPWLRSLVAETSFRPSPTSNPPQPSLPSPGPGASQRMPATSSQPSRLSPACQGQVCLTCLKLAAGQRPVLRAQAQLSPVRPAQVPGATSSVVRLPGSQQPTHGFAASWLRLASGPAQPATHLSPACPAQAPAHLSACQPLGQPSVPRSRLASGQSHVSRLDVPQSCSCLAPSHPAGPAPSAQSELKVFQPETNPPPAAWSSGAWPQLAQRAPAAQAAQPKLASPSLSKQPTQIRLSQHAQPSLPGLSAQGKCVPDPSLKLGWAEAGNAKRLQ